MLTVILKALLCGIAVSIPMGPTGLFVIQRSLTKGWPAGIVAGLGSALADTLYAAFAISALAVVQNFFDSHTAIINLVGGLVVIVLGFIMACRNPFKKKEISEKVKASPTDFAKAMLLALSNPGAIIAMFGMLAIFNVDASTVPSFILTLFGVLAGGALYWILVSFGFSRIRKHVKLRTIIWMNRILGIVVAVFGIYMVVIGVIGLCKLL